MLIQCCYGYLNHSLWLAEDYQAALKLKIITKASRLQVRAEITFLEISCLYSFFINKKYPKSEIFTEGCVFSLGAVCNILSAHLKTRVYWVIGAKNHNKCEHYICCESEAGRPCPEYFLNSSSQLRAHVAKTWLGVQKMIICWWPRIPGLYLAAQKN